MIRNAADVRKQMGGCRTSKYFLLGDSPLFCKWIYAFASVQLWLSVWSCTM